MWLLIYVKMSSTKKGLLFLIFCFGSAYIHDLSTKTKTIDIMLLIYRLSANSLFSSFKYTSFLNIFFIYILVSVFASITAHSKGTVLKLLTKSTSSSDNLFSNSIVIDSSYVIRG